jgi:hypothetical protein
MAIGVPRQTLNLLPLRVCAGVSWLGPHYGESLAAVGGDQPLPGSNSPETREVYAQLPTCIFFIIDTTERVWRRDRDSNPGYVAVYTLSKRAPSATRPSLRLGTVSLSVAEGTDRLPEGEVRDASDGQQANVSESVYFSGIRAVYSLLCG